MQGRGRERSAREERGVKMGGVEWSEVQCGVQGRRGKESGM